MPLDFSVGRIHGDQRRSVEIVAGPRLVVPVGRRIAGAPVDQVQFGIVRSGYPGRTAAMLVAIAAPGFRTRLAFRGHRVGAPHALAGLGVVGVQEPADAGLGAGNADEDLTVHGQRRGGDVIAFLVVIDLGVPTDDSGLGVQRDQVAIHGSVVNHVVQHGHTAIDGRRTDDDHVFGNVGRVGPQRPAGAKIQRRRRAGRLGDVHHAVERQSETSRRSQCGASGKSRLASGCADILPVDLIELREALRLVIARVSDPGRRIAVRGGDALIGNLSPDAAGGQHQSRKCGSRFHFAPPKLPR